MRGPDLQQEAVPTPERLYRIQVAAQMTGLSQGLIRIWEKRYGLVTPRRSGAYRAYTADEIEVLRRIKALTDEGLSIREAACFAPQIRRELETAAARRAEPAASQWVEGGQLDRWREEILARARSYDQQAVASLLDEALSTLPTLAVYERLIVPLQVEVGEQWLLGKLTVAQEHLISEAVRLRLVSRLLTTAQPGSRQVVCACFPEEQHEIGLLGAALRFRELGLRVTYLGQRTPVSQLGHALAQLKPNFVALSCIFDPGKDRFFQTLSELQQVLPAGTQLLVGGRAAAQHAEVIPEARGRLIDSESDWGLFSALAPRPLR